KQLIINQMEDVPTFEDYKLTHAEQIIIRNLEDFTEIEQWLEEQETTGDIPVTYFQENQNQFKNIGFISREKEKIKMLISKFSPWDIRIIYLYQVCKIWYSYLLDK